MLVLLSLPARSRLHQGSTLPIPLQCSSDPRFTSAASIHARKHGFKRGRKDHRPSATCSIV